MSSRTTRRDFLKQSTLAGVGFWVGGTSVSLAQDKKSANERLNIACIGVGGKGSSDTDQAGGVGNVVAICDVDEDYLNAKANKFSGAKKYFDFRKMLEEMDKQIDAVTVSTPDHTHAPASIMAMKMGKHVYCQKPLTHSVYEARLMRDTAAKMKVCTQMGNQGTAENGLREAVEFVQAGMIGKVTEAHVWTNRPVWPQAPKIIARPKEEEPIPPYLHWDLWLGPAPFRPYHHGTDAKKKRGTYHDFNWRGWWDFGTGALGDMACHTANMAFMALKLGHPTTVWAECGDLNPETFPSWARVVFEFPARGDMAPVKFTWYEGQKDGNLVLPSPELQAKVLKSGEKLPGSGSLLVGEKGILYSPNDYGAKFFLLPQKDFEGFRAPAPKLPRNNKGDGGMKAEWAEAIKAGKPEIAMSNFNYAAMLTETILLGNIAIKAGKKLEWDGPALKFKNSPDADKLIKREYRKGWEL